MPTAIASRAAALVLLASLLVGAGPEPELSQAFEVVRTTDEAASFSLQAELLPPADRDDFDAFVGAAGLRTDDVGEVLEVLGLGGTSLGHTNAPGIHVDGKETGTCSAAQQCTLYSTLAAQTITTYSDEGDPDALNRFYFVFEGARLKLDFAGDGWELHPVALSYRFVDHRDSEGVAVAVTAQRGLDIFLSAAAPGGDLGSIAQGMPPCSVATVSAVGRGAGALTLLGGPNEPRVLCPSVGYPVVADHVPSSTSWRAEGPAIGDASMAETRLFVIDLPRCDELIPGAHGSVEAADCGSKPASEAAGTWATP